MMKRPNSLLRWLYPCKEKIRKREREREREGCR
jgi:hypothetical protein